MQQQRNNLYTHASAFTRPGFTIITTCIRYVYQITYQLKPPEFTANISLTAANRQLNCLLQPVKSAESDLIRTTAAAAAGDEQIEPINFQLGAEVALISSG